ncbi:sulfatase [Nannocystis pusilla]|uniref:Sulfatase n=1 Tax=Nannocystis pusilla TaxID=889268 RepID=A0ABS7TP07_9BACT|nr:sulfatase [Nannocystis pusilla]
MAGLAALIDFLSGGHGVGVSAAISALGVGVGAGAVLGGLFAGALRGLQRLPGWARVLAWLVIGGGLTAWLMDQLGVIARFGGKDHADAVVAAVAGLGAGLGLAVLGLIAQPSMDRPAWLSWTRRRPLWAGPGLVLLAIGLIVADRQVAVDNYAAAHTALRVMAVLMLAITGVAWIRYWPRRLRPPVWGRRVLAGLLALPFVWALVVVGGDRDVLAGLLGRPFSSLSLRTLRSLGDIDRDGYSFILGGGDCAPFNAAVHPFAREEPGNGIDDNCSLGDAPVDPPRVDPPIPDTPPPTSVILITIDTLRADHVSWGGKRNTTPEMKKWSESGTRFIRAYTGGSWTSLALSSLFRGVYPRRLVWNPFYETNRFRLLRSSEMDQLDDNEMLKLKFGLPAPEKYVPLQTYLKRRGMYTAAVIDDGSTGFLDLSTGAYPDFDEYHEVSGKALDVAVTDAAIKILDAQPKDRPFFLWAHYFGPHGGHSWHRGVPRWGNSVAGKYDHEIAWTDKHVGRLLARIDELAKEREIAVVITADHGESLGAKRRTHGVGVGEDDIRVPLVVRGPGFAPGTTSKQLVSTVDVMPTILRWTETPAPEGLDGRDLAGILSNPASNKNRTLVAETWRFTANGDATHNMIAVFDGTFKLVCNLLDEGLAARKQQGDKPLPYGEPRIERLQEALDAYLERTGPPNFVD